MNEEKKLVPKLRFPEFLGAEGWRSELMGSVYSFKGNNSLSRDKLNYAAGSVKNIHYGDIHTKFSTHFDTSKESVPYINPSDSLEAFKAEKFCIESDIVFADASEDLEDIGKAIEIVRLNGELVVSGLHTILARQTEGNLVLGFGGHLFKSKWVRTQIQRESQGSKVLGLSGGRLATIKIPFPNSRNEQQKIADCLSSLDELIAALARKVDALKTHKKGLMQQLFPREGETQPRLRFPEFRGDWEEKALGDICHYWNGGSNEGAVTEDGEYYLISLNSIDIEGNLKTSMKRLSNTDKSLQKGDLVMVLSDVAHGNFLGLTDIIPNEKYVLNQRMAGLRLKNECADNVVFLRVFINKNQYYFKQKGQGSSQQNLAKSSKVCRDRFPSFTS